MVNPGAYGRLTGRSTPATIRTRGRWRYLFSRGFRALEQSFHVEHLSDSGCW
jgi:hypothetical protein